VPFSLPLPLTSPFRGFGAKCKIGSVPFGLFAVSSLLLRCFVAEAKAERVKDKSGVVAVRREPLPSPSPLPSPCRRRAVAVPTERKPQPLSLAFVSSTVAVCAVAVASVCRRRPAGMMPKA
jgi:hypothetical protein